MSFFKKLLGIYDKTPEKLETNPIKTEQEQIDREKFYEVTKTGFKEKQRAYEAKKAMDQSVQKKYWPWFRERIRFFIIQRANA